MSFDVFESLSKSFLLLILNQPANQPSSHAHKFIFVVMFICILGSFVNDVIYVCGEILKVMKIYFWIMDLFINDVCYKIRIFYQKRILRIESSFLVTSSSKTFQTLLITLFHHQKKWNSSQTLILISKCSAEKEKKTYRKKNDF